MGLARSAGVEGVGRKVGRKRQMGAMRPQEKEASPYNRESPGNWRG